MDPLDYDHRYPSLCGFTGFLGLRYECGRTRHAYYRQVRLLSDYFGLDPSCLGEDQLRDYLLYVKRVKQWKPKTVRQCAASARLFFVDHLGHDSWKVFDQVRAKDQESLPEVLTREQVCLVAWSYPSEALPYPGETDLLCGASSVGVSEPYGA